MVYGEFMKLQKNFYFFWILLAAFLLDSSVGFKNSYAVTAIEMLRKHLDDNDDAQDQDDDGSDPRATAAMNEWMRKERALRSVKKALEATENSLDDAQEEVEAEQEAKDEAGSSRNPFRSKAKRRAAKEQKRNLLRAKKRRGQKVLQIQRYRRRLRLAEQQEAIARRRFEFYGPRADAVAKQLLDEDAGDQKNTPDSSGAKKQNNNNPDPDSKTPQQQPVGGQSGILGHDVFRVSGDVFSGATDAEKAKAKALNEFVGMKNELHGTDDGKKILKGLTEVYDLHKKHAENLATHPDWANRMLNARAKLVDELEAVKKAWDANKTAQAGTDEAAKTKAAADLKAALDSLEAVQRMAEFLKSGVDKNYNPNFSCTSGHCNQNNAPNSPGAGLTNNIDAIYKILLAAGAKSDGIAAALASHGFTAQQHEAVAQKFFDAHSADLAAKQKAIADAGGDAAKKALAEAAYNKAKAENDVLKDHLDVAKKAVADAKAAATHDAATMKALQDQLAAAEAKVAAAEAKAKGHADQERLHEAAKIKAEGELADLKKAGSGATAAQIAAKETEIQTHKDALAKVQAEKATAAAEVTRLKGEADAAKKAKEDAEKKAAEDAKLHIVALEAANKARVEAEKKAAEAKTEADRKAAEDARVHAVALAEAAKKAKDEADAKDAAHKEELRKKTEELAEEKRKVLEVEAKRKALEDEKKKADDKRVKKAELAEAKKKAADAAAVATTAEEKANALDLLHAAEWLAGEQREEVIREKKVEINNELGGFVTKAKTTAEHADQAEQHARNQHAALLATAKAPAGSNEKIEEDKKIALANAEYEKAKQMNKAAQEAYQEAQKIQAAVTLKMNDLNTQAPLLNKARVGLRMARKDLVNGTKNYDPSDNRFDVVKKKEAADLATAEAAHTAMEEKYKALTKEWKAQRLAIQQHSVDLAIKQKNAHDAYNVAKKAAEDAAKLAADAKAAADTAAKKKAEDDAAAKKAEEDAAKKKAEDDAKAAAAAAAASGGAPPPGAPKGPPPPKGPSKPKAPSAGKAAAKPAAHAPMKITNEADADNIIAEWKTFFAARSDGNPKNMAAKMERKAKIIEALDKLKPEEKKLIQAQFKNADPKGVEVDFQELGMHINKMKP